MLKILWDFLTGRSRNETLAQIPMKHVTPPSEPRPLPMEPPNAPPIFDDEPLAKKIDPVNAARFWAESLKHFDLSELAKRNKSVAPLECFYDLTEVPTKGASEITDDGRPSCSDVYVVLLLSSSGRGGRVGQDGVLHPLAYVGAFSFGRNIQFFKGHQIG